MIDLADIQSIVVRPSAEPTMTLLFFSFRSARQIRQFLADASEAVTTAADWDRPGRRGGAINVGVSGAGIRLADIPTRAYDALSPAFTAGMRAAAPRLSDLGRSDPTRWHAPFEDPTRDVHAVVVGLGDAGLGRFEHGSPGSGGTDHGSFPAPRSPSWHGTALREGREHFGFRDNISDPTIEGSGRPVTPGNGIWDPVRRRWRPVRTGEAVLGYTDESGSIAGHPDAAHVERNGSYLVIRKLEQDVDAFRGACSAWSDELGGALTPEQVAEQMVGRHRDGAPLGRAGTDQPNDFLYTGAGSAGDDIRPSAHIRRANPRDGIASAGAIVPRHQLFRRGMPYEEPATADHPGSRGLLFLACCADLRRQFEFVQSHWIQDGLRFGLGHERDPLLGHREPDDPLVATGDPERSHASIDVAGRRERRALPTFVTTRGGEYFLLPGRRALAYLARMPVPGPGWT